MPYIDQTARDRLYYLESSPPQNAGELNYLITQLALDYLNEHGERYQYFNDIIGALEGAKLELYRRKIAYYEDGKKLENGDIYD